MWDANANQMKEFASQQLPLGTETATTYGATKHNKTIQVLPENSAKDSNDDC